MLIRSYKMLVWKRNGNKKFARMEAEFNQLREEKFKMAEFGRDSMIHVQKCVSK